MVTVGSEEDLEYYVHEAGRVLGVTGKLAQEKRSSKHILEHVFAQLVEFKKLNQVCMYQYVYTCIHKPSLSHIYIYIYIYIYIWT